MALVSRFLTVTQGNIDNKHLYLTEFMDIFPEDALGGADESQAAPRTVRVQWGGEFEDTDIIREKHIFRRRGWVGRFLADARVQAGDRVLLEQIDPYQYRVSREEATA